MKLLQAFKSFLTEESIVENQQPKLVRCWLHNSAAKLIRWRHFNFGSECYFAAANTLSAANANSLQATQFRQ
jgi:hypothetical protein